MEKAKKNPFFLVAFGVVLFVALLNLNYLVAFLNRMIGLIMPILVGLLLAFILSVPMKGLSKLLSRIFKKAESRLIDTLSLILTLVLIAVIVILLCTIAIPELIASVKSIVVLVKIHWPDWAALLSEYGVDTQMIGTWIEKLDLKSIAERILTGAGSLIGSVVNVASSTVTVVINAIFAVVIMFYVLMSKRDLCRQSKKLLYACCKKKTADRICSVAALTHDTYSRFLSGQCVEVIILGLMIFISFLIFRIPYAGLTAVLTAVFAFIPYVGAFASCFIGALLTLIADPSKVLLCIIVYEAVQFIENQFIYPHVVGTSVGLAPLWTLIAALLGGKLFGLAGMVFFIPLTAVVYQLIRAKINRKQSVDRSDSDLPGDGAPADSHTDSDSDSGPA